MKQRIFYFLILFFLTFNISAQNQYSKKIVVNDVDITYACNLEGSVFNSLFTIKNGDKTNDESTFVLDTAVNYYKLIQSNNLLQTAQASKYSSDLASLNIANELIEKLLTEVFNNTKIDRNLVQSIFFHRAIIKHNLRVNIAGDNSFLPHPGFFINKTYFFDQRDYFVKKSVILQVVNSHPEFEKDSSTQELIKYLKNYDQEQLPFDKYYSFYVNPKLLLETIENILNGKDPNKAGNNVQRACAWWCPIGCGSDWGCCGNYSGCCFYRDLICLVHDAGCSYTQCQPRWLCFSGCVPD